MSSKQTPDDGGPAFPEPGLSGLPNGEWIYRRAGMSLRDWFAGQALSQTIGSEEHRADHAYRIADAMIAARAAIAKVEGRS